VPADPDDAVQVHERPPPAVSGSCERPGIVKASVSTVSSPEPLLSCCSSAGMYLPSAWYIELTIMAEAAR